MIRYSKESDREDIKRLVKLCFGNRDGYGIYDGNISGKYILYFTEDGVLVAMTGLCSDSDYGDNCAEIIWTCTHPDYRHQGIMHKLFERMLATTDERIYCSCWKLGTRDKVNLHWLMVDFGFELVLEKHKYAEYPHKCNVGHTCPYWRGTGCSCSENLYVRRGKYDVL
jgi:GNAT superfamily N-acetyltransferase